MFLPTRNSWSSRGHVVVQAFDDFSSDTHALTVVDFFRYSAKEYLMANKV